jgi:hypothetical protein
MYHVPDENCVPRYSDDLDSLDASVFSGEILWTNFNEFEWYVNRWKKELDSHKKLKELDDEDDTGIVHDKEA